MDINPSDIIKSIKTFPPFQWREEGKKFISNQIDGYGSLGFCSANPNGGVHLRLDCNDFRIFCDTSIGEYPQFSKLSLGNKIYYKGEIKEVRPDINGIMMMNCEFDFLPSLVEKESLPDALTINMFNDLYEAVKIKLKLKSYQDFEKWLFESKKIQYIDCRSSRGKETILGHIRNCIHHKDHGIYTKSQLSDAINILKQII